MSSLFEWLRRNSEHYLVEAAQADMARRYLGRVPQPPDPPTTPGRRLAQVFWRQVYVPVYRHIPWPVRRRLIVAMPGSHRRPWQGLGAAPRVVGPSHERSPPASDPEQHAHPQEPHPQEPHPQEPHPQEQGGA